MNKFASILPDERNSVQCYKDVCFSHRGPIDSGVNPQPFGYEEIEKGCHNRLEVMKNLVKNSSIHLDFIVIIENGVVLENDKYYDIGCIMVHDLHMNLKTFKSYTRKVEFPTAYFELSQNSGFQKTVGEFISQDNPNVAKDDWQILFGGRTRVELIVEALCKM